MKKELIIQKISSRFDADLENLDEYCLSLIYQDYIKLENMGYNVIVNSYEKYGNDSFSYKFDVLVNTIDHPIIPGKR